MSDDWMDRWPYNKNPLLLERGYELLFEYGNYDYSWTITEVYKKDERIFTLTDSGCSCTSFGDTWEGAEDAIGAMVETQTLPSLQELGGYDEKAEAIQQKFREVGLR